MVGTNKGQWIRGLKEELADQFKWWFADIHKGMGGGKRKEGGKGMTEEELENMCPRPRFDILYRIE